MEFSHSPATYFDVAAPLSFQLHEPVLPGIYMADWNFEAIEEAFSDAAVNPAVSARALNVVTAQTEAFGAILIPVTGNILPNVPFSDRMKKSLRPYFRREWHVRGEHMLSAAIMNKSGVAHDLKSATR